MYSDEEISRQLRLGEDSRWEFKAVEFAGNRPRSPRRDDWADEIAAFSNAGGGVLLCGVTDAGDVQGMARERMDNLERLIAEICSDSIHPPVRVGIFRRELEEGAAFLLVDVPEGYAQHDSPGGGFIRVGSSKRRMTGDERLRLAQRRGQSRFLWFDKQTAPGTGFGTLSESLWKPLLSAEGAANPELALEKMGLLAPDENGVPRATVAGLLFCAESPEQWLPNACVTATRYRGIDRASGQLDSQTICGPLDRQITQTLAFAVRNMRVAARKDPAREDLPEYSKSALFEAIVNAAVHRDYSIRGSRIRLAMFEDRLELHSPGSLPNNLTVDSMGERQSTRNETLTSILGRIGVGGLDGVGGRRYFMERRGDGVPIIRRETRELCGKLPDFRLIDGAELCVTIPAASLESTSASALIAVRRDGEPMRGADVMALFPNNAWRKATTDANGIARIPLHSTHLPMTAFAAAPGCGAALAQGWIPAHGALHLDMRPLPEGGSAIFPEEIGYIPGLTGRLNPIRDDQDKTYLYAPNLAIEGGKPQPVHFILGEELQLADDAGNKATIRILNIVGQSALVEYRAAPSASLGLDADR